MSRRESNSSLVVLLLVGIVVCVLLAVSGQQVSAAPASSDDLKARVEAATKDFQDLVMVGTITYKNKQELSKVNPSYAQLYEFRSATITFKQPSKLRMDGKLGMVKFECIVDGGIRVIRAPKMGLNKKDDYSKDLTKVQSALDIGILVPSLWENRTIQIVDDAEASANGEIKLRVVYPNNTMINLVWIDAKTLCVKRFEKRDELNVLQVRVVYSNPKQFGNMWVPLKVELFAPDGERAGTSEFGDVKVNSGVLDSVFK